MALTNFVLPEAVHTRAEDQYVGTFVLGPLEPGYGVTIGNALRRVLLSSLEGYAITHVRITGVDHEFSTIKGVREDVVDIILNLKKVRFKALVEDPETHIFVSVSNKETFTAEDIQKATATYEIPNKDLVIAHMNKDVVLEIELRIGKGRGYRSAEENKEEEQPIGIIPIDSIFTPIKKVRYVVENTRVGQRTDYEQLTLEIETDGTITPKQALKEAANILMHHLMLFVDKMPKVAKKKVKETPAEERDEEFERMRRLLKTPINDLNISIRVYNCLKSADITTLGDLVQYTVADLMKFRNFGKKSLMELEELLKEKGLSFGMDVSKYRLDED